MINRNRFYWSVRPLSLFLFAILLLQSCASIVPPSGGEKDLTPPKLVSESPNDSILNQYVYEITLHFDKFMEVHDLNKHLTMSPLLPTPPTVITYGKRVEIKLPDSSLQANTTYRISLGNALTDNREHTPFQNYAYQFSTGAYFDSLSLKGYVLDAATGQPDTMATIFLYPADTKDSAILRERPEYVQPVDAMGHFTFTGLPKKPFKIFAIKDDDNNYIYTQNKEKIDFHDTLVLPSVFPDSNLSFSVFMENTIDSVSQEENLEKKSPKNRFRNEKKSKDKPALAYRVLVDTNRQTVGTFDISKSLKITLLKPLSKVDSNRIHLSYDESGIEVVVSQQVVIDSFGIRLSTDWKADKTYTLRLTKGWAIDTAKEEVAPGKYRFHTRALTDYATLNINIDSAYVGDTFLFVLLKADKEIWTQTATAYQYTVPLLLPGKYTLHLVFDKNKNGHWDTGNIFSKKHAEKVLPYKGNILLKAGWVNDVDFKVRMTESDHKKDRFLEK